MLRILSPTLLKMSQSFLDEVRDDLGDNRERLITEDNYQDHLVDNLQEDALQPRDQTLDTGEPPISDWLDEIPMGSYTLGIPEDAPEIPYDNPLDLVYDGIDKNEVISFHYTTRGYGNEEGRYAGLRTVEPHYTFVAYTTGNEVLVSYDRDVSDIRAFIIGNIHPDGVRYEGVQFEERPDIMVGIV